MNMIDAPFQKFCKFSNPQTITCIIFENLFGPYFLPHQSHSYGYAPSSGEILFGPYYILGGEDVEEKCKKSLKRFGGY